MKKLLEVEELICRRCLGSWIAKVESPKVCALCKSPSWNKDRLRTGDVGAVNKYGFDVLVDFKWHYFPYFLDKNAHDGMDLNANFRMSRSLEQFIRRKNWSYEYKLGSNEAGQVCLAVRRTK